MVEWRHVSEPVQSSRLSMQAGRRQRKNTWGMGVFWNLKIASSDIFSPERPCLLIIPQYPPIGEQVFKCLRLIGDMSIKPTDHLPPLSKSQATLYHHHSPSDAVGWSLLWEAYLEHICRVQSTCLPPWLSGNFTWNTPQFSTQVACWTHLNSRTNTDT